jgi:hypothetical protein
MTLAVETPDAGSIVGLGIVFESSTFADEFHRQMFNYFDTPGGAFRSFMVHMHDAGTYCDVAIDVTSPIGSMSVSVKQADHRVLDDIVAALGTRPYFFIIACLTGEDGGIQPYKPDDNFVAKGNIYVDGNEVRGNPEGSWTTSRRLFT